MRARRSSQLADPDEYFRFRYLSTLVQEDGSHYDIIVRAARAVKLQKLVNNDEVTLYVFGTTVESVRDSLRDFKHAVADKVEVRAAIEEGYNVVASIKSIYGPATTRTDALANQIRGNIRRIADELSVIGGMVSVSDFRRLTDGTEGVVGVDIELTSDGATVVTDSGDHHLGASPGVLYTLHNVEVEVN